MTEEIKKYKLYIIQKKYNSLINIINIMEEHYNELIRNNIIDNVSEYSNIMYELIKNLNTQYNNSITKYYDNDNKTEIDNLIKSLNNMNDNKIILKILDNYINTIPCELFKESENEIRKLLNKFGYKQIKLLLEYLYAPNYFSKSVMDLINEIDDIVIPISYNIYNNANMTENEYFWKLPNNYEHIDLLHKKRELWIKLNNKNKSYIRIDVIFKIDRFSSKSKTSQLKSPILEKQKNEIFIKLKDYNIDTEFTKSFIRHDYLGNIYCMSVIEYMDYLLKMYTNYTKLIGMTFVNIMKDFVGQNNIKKMFDIILLLLLGDNDKIDISGLLMNLVKDKKGVKIFNNVCLFEYLYENLTFYLQSKIKKSNITIKNSIDKLKSVNIEEVDYKKQLAVSKNIPENVKAMVLDKLGEMKSFNNEYYKQLLYVKTILNYPWSSSNDDLFYQTLNKNKKQSKEYLLNVENKLNKTCYGHDKAKKLLLQMIGKWISNPSSMGTCFGLVGPPGVGKTLLAKSVSKALDIPFGQITLGGQNDGEILHGHGYTYSGSQPGMIIKKMVEMGKSRCILYFDELDKACSKHGTINEITSILIHLTDPNMNKTFQDRFFQGIEFPLDKVIMIFSYNDSSKVDPVLLDRIKEIKVEPYTMEDKLQICTKHIIEEMAENVSMENEVIFNEDIIKYLIDNYTNEAGVRDIKRKIEEIFLHLNIEKIYGKLKKGKINININKINEILKEPDIYKRVINTKPEIGIINGLYATNTGMGGITPIQIYPNMQHSHDKYEVRLTGKQGEIMKESVICSLTAAIEWLKNSIYKDKLDDLMKTNVKNGFHVHTPDGATPKDGPSAGCAFTCAFISRILNKNIKNDIAMTGEIELTGKISKIGGLEFKLQGAKRAGVKTVYIPMENKKDLDEIKEKYKNLIDNDFNIILVNHIDEIINDILI